MNIPAIQARPLFTQMVIAVYRLRMKPTYFLRSFFVNDETLTKLIGIEVQRGFENVAVDVYRNSEGNRNTFGKSTERVYEPPYYHETVELTSLDLYEMLFLSAQVSNEVFAAFVSAVADKMVTITDKIERAYELQASQVLEDGIVVLKSGDNINYNRQAGSLVDAAGAGGYWTGGAVDPNTILELGATFIRTEGMAAGGVLNVIMGSQALNAFMNNTIVKGRQAYIKDFALDRIIPAQRNAAGGALHGSVSVGSYDLRIWTYPQYYKHPVTGVKTPYVNPKKIIMLPETPDFKLVFAAVPQLLEEGETPKKGAYLVQEFKDKKKASHEIDIRSAGLAVPIGIDQIFTAQVVA